VKNSEKGLSELGRINVTDPLKRISDARKSGKDIFDKTSSVVGETAKELSLLPLRNIGAISNLIWKKSFSVLGSVLKTGGQAAMLIPLPLPGGMKNFADVRGSATALRKAIDMKAQGNNPESFRDLFDRIRGVRNDAEKRATAQAS
jgi:hypothetical protein